MRFGEKWIYWKDQCDICANAENCKYEVKDYIEQLDAVEPKTPVYGNLEFVCDYFYLDEDKYKANEIYGTGEHCCG